MDAGASLLQRTRLSVSGRRSFCCFLDCACGRDSRIAAHEAPAIFVTKVDKMEPRVPNLPALIFGGLVLKLFSKCPERAMYRCKPSGFSACCPQETLCCGISRQCGPSCCARQRRLIITAWLQQSFVVLTFNHGDVSIALVILSPMLFCVGSRADVVVDIFVFEFQP
jgi:hypothetical protein